MLSDEVITWGGPQAQTGRNTGHTSENPLSVNENDGLGRAQHCVGGGILSGEVVRHLYCVCFESCYLAGGAVMHSSTQGTEQLKDACVSLCACRLVLLSAPCQGGVNSLGAISGAQLVYPDENNSKLHSSQLQRGYLPLDAAPKLEITVDMNIHEQCQ